jgi:hypothetical protein
MNTATAGEREIVTVVRELRDGPPYRDESTLLGVERWEVDEGALETLLTRAADLIESLTRPVQGGAVGREETASRDHDPTISVALEKAIYIAVGAHNGQIDKGGAPYIHHVFRVMRAVDGKVEKTVAVLHDLLEDCPDWDAARLRDEGLSDEVVAAVVALTRREGEMYSDFIDRAAKNELARRVKLADLADNSDLTRIRSPSRVDKLRVEKYARAIATLSSAKPSVGDSSRDELDRLSQPSGGGG